ncbi:MAG: efflux RND transporter periplasmic adaptor subunit [Planctomycetota bacterium]
MVKVQGAMAIGLAVGLAAICICQMAPTDPARAQERRDWVGVSLPSRTAAVGPEQPGVIVEMPKPEGARVAKGEVLFRLSSEIQSLEVERLEALVGSRAAVDKAQKKLEHSRRVEQRLLRLMEKEITSDAELQEAQYARMMASAEYDQVVLEQGLQANRLKQARVLLAQRTVRSPVSGLVTDWHKQPGEPTNRLEPVVEVARLDPLWVTFDCPIRDQRLFRLDAEVMVAPALEPHNQRKAKVVFVSMRATPSSHTFRVRLSTANPARDWKAGQKMVIRIGQPNATPPAGKNK